MTAMRRDEHLRLGDVATVVEDHQPLIGDALVDDGPGLMLVIEKLPGANTLRGDRRGVEAALARSRPGLAGIDIDTTSSGRRPSSRRRTTIAPALLDRRGAAAAGLALLLFEWRAALIALVGDPVSVARRVRAGGSRRDDQRDGHGRAGGGRRRRDRRRRRRRRQHHAAAPARRRRTSGSSRVAHVDRQRRAGCAARWLYATVDRVARTWPPAVLPRRRRARSCRRLAVASVAAGGLDAGRADRRPARPVPAARSAGRRRESPCVGWLRRLRPARRRRGAAHVRWAHAVVGVAGRAGRSSRGPSWASRRSSHAARDATSWSSGTARRAPRGPR